MSISNDFVLQDLRRRAGLHDEWATKSFWLGLFNRHIFTDPKFSVSTEVPPDEYSQRRDDLVVEEYGLDGGNALSVLMFVEAKKARAEPQDIVGVETQAFEACLRYMSHHNRSSVWAMTCFGTSARLWMCQPESAFLEPVYPREHTHGERSSYLELYQNEQGFMQAFHLVLKYPKPDDEVLGTDQPEQTGESSNIAAPV